MTVNRLTSERLLLFLSHEGMFLLLLLVMHLLLLLLLMLMLHRGHQVDGVELVQTELFGWVLLSELSCRGRA